MPYIAQERRKELDPLIKSLIINLLDNGVKSGDVNYTITKIVDMLYSGFEYDYYNAAIGILECVKQEYYRRRVIPYEQQKCSLNGDVFL